MRSEKSWGGALLYLHRYYLSYKCEVLFCGFSKNSQYIVYIDDKHYMFVS